MKYAINIDVSKKSKEDFLKLCTKNEIENKDYVLKYMKSAKVDAYSTAYVFDVVNNDETTIDEVLYSDGNYLWSSSWIYYFEKYNLKLNDDFIEHVLSKIK